MTGSEKRNGAESRPGAQDGDNRSSHEERMAAQWKLLGDVYDFLKPEAQAISARTTYLALTDQIVVDNRAIQKALIKTDSPVAKQLLGRWKLMEEQGWLVEHGDDALFARNKQLSKNSVGLLCDETKSLHYRQPTKFWDRILGGPDHIKEAASIVGHELSHRDGHYWTMVDPLDTQANRTMGFRQLDTEARALVTQAHLAQAMKTNVPGIAAVKDTIEALRNKDLGGYIYRNWMDPRIPADWSTRFVNHPNPQWRYTRYGYPEFQFLTEVEARDHVNQYLKKTFGEDLFDHRTGRIKPVNIDAGLGQMNHPLLPCEAGRPLLPVNERFRLEPGFEGLVRKPFGSGESNAFGRFHRGLYVVGGLSTLAMTGELVSKFSESPGAGFGQAARVGANWGTFELTARIAQATLGRRLTPRVGVLAGLAAGALTSWGADALFGDTISNTVRKNIDR